MEYILLGWVLVLAYFHIKLTERVKALEDDTAPTINAEER